MKPKEIIKTKTTISTVIGVALICFIMGYMFCYIENIHTTDEQIEYIEGLMDDVDGLMGVMHVGQNWTIIQSINWYKLHQTVQSRVMLKGLVSQICGVRGESNFIRVNITGEDCMEMCENGIRL